MRSPSITPPTPRLHKRQSRESRNRADGRSRLRPTSPIPPRFTAIQALGPLAGLVNNAGSTGRAVRVEEQEEAELTRLFAVNVVATILACKEAVLRMSTRHGGSGGAIVNISSIAARLGALPGLGPYAASKGAVESFTKGFANEVGPEGIRVNAVAPGMIETDMSQPLLAQAGARERIEAMTPLRRVGAPEEIAEAVAWLISPAAKFVTGSVVTVSGGR
jgi:NAD(P)-dependent dehydrogenase (short-subunit alcohol dehydrogenase family)